MQDASIHNGARLDGAIPRNPRLGLSDVTTPAGPVVSGSSPTVRARSLGCRAYLSDGIRSCGETRILMTRSGRRILNVVHPDEGRGLLRRSVGRFVTRRHDRHLFTGCFAAPYQGLSRVR
jgi:hypothetical protein